MQVRTLATLDMKHRSCRVAGRIFVVILHSSLNCYEHIVIKIVQSTRFSKIRASFAFELYQDNALQVGVK